MRKCWIIHSMLIFALVMMVILTSCGTTSMNIRVKRPAEVNLKGYQKIAIGDMVNPNNKVDKHSQDLSDEFTSTLFKSGYFEVLDRQHLAKILEEQGLGQTGLIDESSAAQIGKIIGVAVFVYGRIQDDKYSENTSKGDPTKDKEGKTHQKFYRDGAYNLMVNVKLIDTQTAKILAVKTLSSKKTQRTTADNSQAPKIDPNLLFRQCVNDISSQFMKLVAPHEVVVKASFEKDDKLPEVKQAISFFKIGEWDDGVALLQKATEKPKLKNEVRAKAFYNMGLAQTYSGDFDNALANLKKALELNPKSSRYQRAITNAKAEREKAEKLKEQL